MTTPNETTSMLDEVGRVFDEYVAFPSEEARDAVILWVAHTHVFKSFESSPRLAILSREPGSGKSRVLEIIENLVPNPTNVVDAHPAILWRTIDQSASATLLLDEVDTIFGRVGSSSSHQQLRGLVNAGHRRGATIPRCVGNQDVRHFNVFAPIAMAGLGILPETIMTRSVIIQMRKRRGGQKISPFRLKYAAAPLACAKYALEEWAMDHARIVELAYPDMPVEDRKADVWEPLLAIAELAGSEWIERAYKACKSLTADNDGKPMSISDILLTDLHKVFNGADKMATVDILTALYTLEDGDMAWTPENLGPRQLAAFLGEFGIERTTFRDGERTMKGYVSSDITPHWDKVVSTPNAEDFSDETPILYRKAS